MSLDEVKGRYGGDGVALSDGLGGKALGVLGPSGNGLLFRTDKDGHVTAMEAGRYETLEFRFTEGEGC